MSAVVCQVGKIEKHPNADRLEQVFVTWPMTNGQTACVAVVTGRHYREGQLGVYIPPGTVIPGDLAVESWLVGKGKIDQPYTVLSKNMRGIESPGLFMGQWYCKDASDWRSVVRFAEQQGKTIDLEHAALAVANDAGSKAGPEWIKWRYWRDEWHLGEDVSADLGITVADAETYAHGR